MLQYGCFGATAPTWLDDVREIAPGKSMKNVNPGGGGAPSAEEMER